MERGRIALNIGSMLPWSGLSVIGLPLAAWITREAATEEGGYAFWQVLPFRSVTVAGLKRTGIPIRVAEPAWNATTFRAHFRGEPGAAGGPTKLQDPLFFSGNETCDPLFHQVLREFDAIPIYHTIEKGREGLVEVHLGLGKSVMELVDMVTEGMVPQKPYVIDLCHLRHFQMTRLAMWQALKRLLPFTSLIHVQAVSENEWREFIAGSSTVLGGMIRFIRDKGYAGPFVVEFDPRATGLAGLLPWRLANNLRIIRERIEENI